MKNLCFIKLAFILLLFASSCKKGDSPPSGNSGCIVELINVTGNIDVATTWDACHIYHVTNQLLINAPLTIEAGTIIKMDAAASITVYETGGKITAVGTADKQIVFTSWKDDTNGGDNNGDANASSPQAGDWTNISLANHSDNKFSYCKILYAGGSQTPYYAVAVQMGYGENNELTHSTIAHNFGAIDHSSGTINMSASPATTIFNNNTFFDNFRPFAISNIINIDNSNTFHNPNNAAEINACNGIFVVVANTSDIPNITYAETEVPYVFAAESSYTIPLSVTLTLADNVVIKMGNSFTLVLYNESQLINHAGSGVVFTSYKDDSVLGDTNGDGNTSSPAVGDWKGIWDAPNGVYFKWGNIFYASN